MDLPDISDVKKAAHVLRGHAVRTPLIESVILNEITGGRIFLKAECLQRTGSFKFRGAYNALSNLSDEQRAKGIVATSSGNHAQGVAEAARLFGCEATIIMPKDAPEIKKQRTRRSGATIIEYDRYSEDRETLVQKLAQERGAPLIHPYENRYVIAGQGTCGLEAMQDLQAEGLVCDRILVCAGGGGLTSGITLAARSIFPKVSIHTVEPAGYDDFKRSLEAGEVTGVDVKEASICDAILTPSPGQMAFGITKDLLDEGLVVTDDQALEAVAFAFNELKLVVEPGGCVTLAALLAGRIDVSGQTVVATLSGGNIDPSVLSKALAA